jgi:integrase
MGGNTKGNRRRFGAVRQLPSGRWQARYPGPDGLLRTASHTFERRRDAEVWLTHTEADMQRGDWIDPDAGRVPFGEYAEAWINERPGLRLRTQELYRGLLRLHLMPTFGNRTVADVSFPSVRAWRKALLDAGVSEITIAKAYRLLRAILNTAVEDGLILRNPCRIKGGGLEPTPERPIISIAQAYGIADAIQPRYRALVLLAMFGSLRWGELMGLRRNHIDFATGTVRVDSSAVESAQGISFGPTKTAAGRRTVAIPDVIIPELRWHLQRFAEPGPDGRVFVGPNGATPRRSNFNRIWRQAVTEAGVSPELHFHDLRHTGNTLAAATGASLRELMSRMGHASSRAALIYQHATNDRDRAIAEALNELAKTFRTDDHRAQSGTNLARDA